MPPPPPDRHDLLFDKDFSEGSSSAEELEEVEEVEEVEEIEIEEETSESDPEHEHDAHFPSRMVPTAASGSSGSSHKLQLPTAASFGLRPFGGTEIIGPLGSSSKALEQSAFTNSVYAGPNSPKRVNGATAPNSAAPFAVHEDAVLSFDEDDEDDDDDDENKFVVIEESDLSSDDEGLFSTEANVKQRREADEAAETYEDWALLERRKKLLGFLEPTAVGAALPPKVLAIARVYGALQFLGAMGHPTALLLVSLPEVSSTISESMFYATTALAAVDFVLRLAAGAGVVSLLIDAAILLASIFVILDMFLAELVMVHIALLRGVRAFRISMLLEQFETFRDIYLVFRTIVNSIQSLFIFLCIFFIGLFIFATGVYVIERDHFRKDEGVWYRRCKDFGGCEVERSPYQSIPDALWLTMASMSTVGYGDSVPATTPGRIIIGLAIISGVFVIAFPTMILVGNLWLTRRRYFKLEEFRLRVKEERRLTKIASQKHALSMANFASFGSDDVDGERLLGNSVPTLSSLPQLQGSQSEENGHAPTGIASFGGVMLVGESALNQVDQLARKATFAFMGEERREVVLTKAVEYHYLPLMEILLAPDGMPLVCAATERGDGYFTFALLLILDCSEAQEAAVDALNNRTATTVARAAPVYGLEVRLVEPVEGLQLLRRVDTGEVVDHAVPLHFLCRLPAGHTAKSFIPRAREMLASATFQVTYSPHPTSSSTWRRTFFVDSEMLRETPFIQDLKVISVHVAPQVLMQQAVRSSSAANSRPSINKASKVLKNVAFVSQKHLATLFDPFFTAITEKNTTIRNHSQLLESLCEAIVLHSRELRLHDIPMMLHGAVYAFHELEAHEKVLEIDVDFFQFAEWPLGVVMAEFSDKQLKLARTVRVGAGAGYQQPSIPHLASCDVDFKINRGRRKSYAVELRQEVAEDGEEGEFVLSRHMRPLDATFSAPDRVREAVNDNGGIFTPSEQRLEDSWHLDPDNDDDWEV